MRMKQLGALAGALALGPLALAASRRRRRRRVRLEGATVAVCGASRGLGRAIALELGRRRIAKIALCARREHDLDDLAAELVDKGIHVCAEACDLSKPDEVQTFLGSACARLGPIDVLVTNASTITVGPADAWTRRDFDDAFSSIFYTALNPILEILPSMRQRRAGTIAVITSIGARVGVPHLAPYCAAKAAVMGLAESLRAEIAADGVHLLTVVPGLMRTGSHVHAEFKGDHEREYAWFGASAVAPVISIDANRAARRIVSAIERGDAEIAFTPEARLAPVVRAVAPGLWAAALEMVARRLPRGSDAPRAHERREGIDIEAGSSSALIQAIRKRGHDAAREHGQFARG